MRRGHEAGRKGVSGRPPPPPPGAVRGSACGCRAFLVEFCGPGRTDSPGAGLWGRQVPLLTDGCAVQGCGAPALGSARPGPALTAGPRPHLWAPPPQDPTHDAPTRSTTQPCSPRSPSARRAEGRCGAGRCGMGMRGDGRTGDGTGGRAAGAGRGREGGWVGVHAGARGRAWPGCAHHCAHVFGGCTRVCVSVVPGAARGGVPVPGCAHTCLGRLRFRPPPRELPEPPECRCRGARVRPLLPLFGHFGPVQSARGGRARPPPPPRSVESRPVSPGPAAGPRSSAAAAP